MKRWTWRMRFWHRLHGVVNRIAWDYAMLPGHHKRECGAGKYIDKARWLWRLNDWLYARWGPEWLRRRSEPINKGENDERP